MTVLEFVSARKRASGGCVSRAGVSGEWTAWKASCGRCIFQPIFSIYPAPLSLPHLPLRPPSKGNDLAETLFVQRHSAFRAWSRAEMGCYDKGLCDEKSKMEPLVDRLFPRTITLPAVPNRRLQEISAREGCSAQTGG